MKNFLVLLFCTGLVAQEFWQDISERTVPQIGTRYIQPIEARTLECDIDSLRDYLTNAPKEWSGMALELDVPFPDGTTMTFLVVESSIMEGPLQDRFPDIRTFKGRSIGKFHYTGRFDVTPQGFHAMMRGDLGAYYIDPLQTGDDAHYQSYFRINARPIPGNEWVCETLSDDSGERGTIPPIGDELLEYRIAIATTGEYTQFHGGTVELGLAAVVTALNRVNQVYENDLAIRMNLVANNDQIIYTDPGSDPYTNNNPSLLLSQNQTNLDTVIGSANYDVGHVFSTGGGGLASLRVICVNGAKARGETGLSSPIGDPFYIDYVAHELGHQWGGNHTFNSIVCAGNRNGSTAYEPGSGSTIQAYAGICGSDNLQPNSDPYFHGVSFDEMVDHSRNGSGSTCGTSTPTGNSIPTIDAGPSFTIPAETPFELTAVGNDSDPDLLTYCWEEFDLGPASAVDVDNGSSPIFRSFEPTSSPVRTFPQLDDILNGTSTVGVILPTTDRTMTFRVTIRDNAKGGAGSFYDSTQVTVENDAGPFEVTSQTTATTYDGGSTQSFTWDVAGTDQAPISCAEVDILLSVDGGLNFTEVIALNQPNTGTATLAVPNVATTNGRIKIICSDNVFFNINSGTITIVEMVLLCTGDLENWTLATDGQFLDPNGNGVVDVADLISCLGI